LNIRRFTNQATKIFKLIKSDIGRPFTDQVSDLIYPELATDAVEVLRTLVFIQKQIPTKDGRWFTIRIMPYRTFDDRIDGLVITFINHSDLRQVEVKLHETEQLNDLFFNTTSDVIIKLSTSLKILKFNPEAGKFFGKKPEDAVNKNFIQMFIPGPLQKKNEKAMNKLLDELLDGKIKMQVIAAGGNTPVIEWSVNILLNDLKMAAGMILINKKQQSNE
jgi:two-component system CheB/CheR fusion protein